MMFLVEGVKSWDGGEEQEDGERHCDAKCKGVSDGCGGADRSGADGNWQWGNPREPSIAMK